LEGGKSSDGALIKKDAISVCGREVEITLKPTKNVTFRTEKKKRENSGSGEEVVTIFAPRGNPFLI